MFRRFASTCLKEILVKAFIYYQTAAPRTSKQVEGLFPLFPLGSVRVLYTVRQEICTVPETLQPDPPPSQQATEHADRRGGRFPNNPSSSTLLVSARLPRRLSIPRSSPGRSVTPRWLNSGLSNPRR